MISTFAYEFKNKNNEIDNESYLFLVAPLATQKVVREHQSYGYM